MHSKPEAQAHTLVKALNPISTTISFCFLEIGKEMQWGVGSDANKNDKTQKSADTLKQEEDLQWQEEKKKKKTEKHF